MKDREKAGDKAPRNRVFMQEAHQDLAESKNSVRELLRLRQEMFRGKPVDGNMLKMQKKKALEALNNLFIDETGGGE